MGESYKECNSHKNPLNLENGFSKQNSNEIFTNNDTPQCVEGEPAPDGGWGWAVVVASFIICTMVDGTNYTFYVIYSDLLDHFEAGIETTVVIGSLMYAVCQFSGPFTGALCNRFGCRTVAMTGSIMMALGLLLSTFSTDITSMILSYSILGGLGSGFMILPSLVIVGQYFDRRRALATGIVMCGSGFGSFVFAPLGTFLVQMYGWKCRNIFMAAVLLHGALCGAVMRPLNRAKTVAKSGDKNTIICEIKVTELSAGKSELRLQPPSEQRKTCLIRLRKGVIKAAKMFNLNLLISPTYLAYSASVFFVSFGLVAPYVYTPLKAQEVLSISKERATIIVSVMGAFNIAGRFLGGFIADRRWLKPIDLFAVASLLAGLSTTIQSFVGNYSVLMIYGAIYGMSIAVCLSVRPLVLAEMFGVERLGSSLGIIITFSGIAVLTGNPLFGAILDLTCGNFTIPFLIFGLLVAFGSLICLSVKRIESWELNWTKNRGDRTKNRGDRTKNRGDTKKKNTGDCG